MVVSLTLVPVLSARYLARRRMPSTGPIYELLARAYEAVLRVLLRFPRTVVFLSLMAVVLLGNGWISVQGLMLNTLKKKDMTPPLNHRDPFFYPAQAVPPDQLPGLLDICRL